LLRQSQKSHVLFDLFQRAAEADEMTSPLPSDVD